MRRIATMYSPFGVAELNKAVSFSEVETLRLQIKAEAKFLIGVLLFTCAHLPLVSQDFSAMSKEEQEILTRYNHVIGGNSRV